MNDASWLGAARRLAVAVGLLLLVPLLAMPFSSEATWGFGDFLAAGALLFGAGMAYVIATRRARTAVHRALVAAVIVAGVATVWAELAVGLFH